jgi:hypothetical protein
VVFLDLVTVMELISWNKIKRQYLKVNLKKGNDKDTIDNPNKVVYFKSHNINRYSQPTIL